LWRQITFTHIKQIAKHVLRFVKFEQIDSYFLFFSTTTATSEIYTLSLHDALPISDEALQIEGELMGEAKNKDAITLIDPIEGTHYEHNVIDDIPDLSVEETVAMNEPTEPKVSFAKLSETKPGESVIMMDYGSSGSGKTEFHGTGGSRAFIIDTGDGLETLRAPGFHSRHPNSDPTIARVAEKLGQRGNITTATAFDAVCDIIDF